MTSTTGHCFYFGSISSFFLSFSFIYSPLFSSSILGIYLPWEFIFQCHIFLPFKLFKARTLKWLAIPFSNVTRFVRAIHHDLSVLGALPGVAHSSVESDKAVIHVITLVSFLFLLFSFYLPSGDGVEGHMLIFCENSKTTTHCLTTVNWRMLDLTKNRYLTSKGKGETQARW